MIQVTKQLISHAKPRRGFIRLSTILSLLVLLQGFGLCHNKILPPTNMADFMVRELDSKNFEKEVSKRGDCSELLQNKQGKDGRSLFYAATRAKDIEKLKYLVKLLDTTINNKQCSNPDILNVPDALSGKTPLVRAIETNNGQLIKTLLSGPNINFVALDSKKRSPLHIAAVYNKDKAFPEVWNVVKAQEEKKAIDHLFKEDTKGHSVFASAYLPESGSLGWFSRTGPHFSMFKSVLKSVKQDLQVGNLEGHLKKINDEIGHLKENGAIGTRYADSLHKEVELIGNQQPTQNDKEKKN